MWKFVSSNLWPYDNDVASPQMLEIKRAFIFWYFRSFCPWWILIRQWDSDWVSFVTYVKRICCAVLKAELPEIFLWKDRCFKTGFVPFSPLLKAHHPLPHYITSLPSIFRTRYWLNSMFPGQGGAAKGCKNMVKALSAKVSLVVSFRTKGKLLVNEEGVGTGHSSPYMHKSSKGRILAQE